MASQIFTQSRASPFHFQSRFCCTLRCLRFFLKIYWQFLISFYFRGRGVHGALMCVLHCPSAFFNISFHCTFIRFSSLKPLSLYLMVLFCCTFSSLVHSYPLTIYNSKQSFFLFQVLQENYVCCLAMIWPNNAYLATLIFPPN